MSARTGRRPLSPDQRAARDAARASYANVIWPDPRGPWQVAAWHGCQIVQQTLSDAARTADAARAEAQALYPDREILVPRLGERSTP